MSTTRRPKSIGGQRSRGRPRLEVDPDAVANAVEELIIEGGLDLVTVPRAAEKLDLSRATLYRTVQTKQQLLGIQFERSTRILLAQAQAVLDRDEPPGAQLHNLIRVQVDAAIRMRAYMPTIHFGANPSDLPADVVERWQEWNRSYDQLWIGMVQRAMDSGDLQEDDPILTARLVLGMCNWVSRWYRPGGGYESATIADAVIRLLRIGGA